jgi:UDP-GlcNAc:undecaprenyl-phosphate/decaprenyl-phosphate GlcNAc-1-phosphate transferase
VRPRVAGASLAAALVGVSVRRALDARTGPGWRRQNYRGDPVTLSAGPAAVAGLLAGAAVGLNDPDRVLTAATVAIGGAAVAGFYDDRASAQDAERETKGFAGHLGALADGKASAGTVKIGLIGATSLAAAAIRSGRSVDTVIDGCLVAGAANLVNLLDLRPGRALKVAGAVALVSTLGTAAPYDVLLGAVCGTVVGLLPADLGGRSMLGDTGANAIGAAVGSALCGRGRRTRLSMLVAVAGLTGLSERVSFTAVIAGNPVLRRLDELGRAGG